MPNLPDFSAYGYEVTEQLPNSNIQGGRIAYKAIEIATQQPVVIKQFRFANATWEDYDEIKREINLLQDFNHAGIPKFEFDPGDGLCLVLEYKPEVNLDKSELNFVANKAGEKIYKLITVSNNIPETLLQGKWSVSAHKNDPPHTPDSHNWISFSPQSFEGNEVMCAVTVDTSKLKAYKNYERELVLVSNAQQEKYSLKVKVKTLQIQDNVSISPYTLILVYYLVVALIIGILGHGLVLSGVDARVAIAIVLWVAVLVLIMVGPIVGAIIGATVETIVGAIIGATVGAMGGAIVGAMGGAMGVMIGAMGGAIVGAYVGRAMGGRAIVIGIIIVGLIILAIILVISLAKGENIFTSIILAINMINMMIVPRFIGNIFLELVVKTVEATVEAMNNSNIFGQILGTIKNVLKRNFYNRGFRADWFVFYVVATTVVSILTGVGAVIGFNTYVLTGLWISGIPLGVGLIYPPLKLWRLKAEYRRQESQNLIDS